MVFPRIRRYQGDQAVVTRETGQLSPGKGESVLNKQPYLFFPKLSFFIHLSPENTIVPVAGCLGTESHWHISCDVWRS